MSRLESFYPGQVARSDVSATQLHAWQKDRQTWAEHHPVTAALLEPLEIVAVNEPWLSTATTDGRCIAFNPNWSAELDEVQRRQAQQHIVWHAAAGDYHPSRGLDVHRWHLACDHSVNTQLLRLGADIPPDSVLFPIAATWRRKEVYAWLAGHPRPEVEQSIDQLSWQLNRMASASTLKALDTDWQRHNRATVKRFLGTPWLTDTVAMWLLGHR